MPGIFGRPMIEKVKLVLEGGYLVPLSGLEEMLDASVSAVTIASNDNLKGKIQVVSGVVEMEASIGVNRFGLVKGHT